MQIYKNIYNKKNLLISLFFWLSSAFLQLLYAQAGNHSPFRSDFRADSVAIKHVNLSLSVEPPPISNFIARADLKIQSRISTLSKIRLDLISAFSVDSVRFQNSLLSFQHVNQLLHIDLPFVLSNSDSMEISIFYTGSPTTATGNFGGFYWGTDYSFNLGVALNEIPHSAGRYLFPCIDDFNTKSTFTYQIEVPSTLKVAAGGVLDSISTPIPGKHRFHFHLNLPIPSYLASINIGPYHKSTSLYASIYGPLIPIVLHAADTVSAGNSLSRLAQMTQLFESHYGPFIWPQIGYSLVPFSSGAMEHACNISYPQAAANGSMAYEFLAAHELAHSWWGNNTTCETAEEMWLNEGFASYSEFLFRKYLNSPQDELNEYLDMLDMVLDNAHIDDQGYHPLSGMPQAHTYGTHSYKKGALVLRSLQHYMGDSLFFAALKEVQIQKKLQSMNTDEFFQIMSDESGIDLTFFKNDWILQPGFSTLTLESSQYNNSVFSFELHQKNRAVLQPFSHLYTDIRFIGANRQVYDARVYQDSPLQTHSISPGFEPQTVILNANNAFAYASMGQYLEIKSPGTKSFSYTKAALLVESMGGADSVAARLDLHRVAPEDGLILNDSLLISPGKYWTYQSIAPNGFRAHLRLQFDGGPLGYEEGIIFHKDDIRVLYRPNAQHNWKIWENDSLYYINPNTKKGVIMAMLASPGDYAIGSIRQDLSVMPSNTHIQSLKSFPNPASDFVYFMHNENIQEVQIFNAEGQLLQTLHPFSKHIQLPSLANGLYFLRLKDLNNKIYHSNIVVYK